MGALRLQGFTIGATDGDIGRVDAFYFDDTSFTVRHLVVDTGGWLTGRRVLISPMALPAIDWDGKRINAELTKSQVEQSPDIDTDRRLQKETETRPALTCGFFLDSPTIVNGGQAEAGNLNLPCAGLSSAP